jgi:hypothetical protein
MSNKTEQQQTERSHKRRSGPVSLKQQYKGWNLEIVVLSKAILGQAYKGSGFDIRILRTARLPFGEDAIARASKAIRDVIDVAERAMK